MTLFISWRTITAPDGLIFAFADVFADGFVIVFNDVFVTGDIFVFVFAYH